MQGSGLCGGRLWRVGGTSCRIAKGWVEDDGSDLELVAGPRPGQLIENRKIASSPALGKGSEITFVNKITRPSAGFPHPVSRLRHMTVQNLPGAESWGGVGR